MMCYDCQQLTGGRCWRHGQFTLGAWWYRRQRREELREFMREMRREWEDLTGVDREWPVEE